MPKWLNDDPVAVFMISLVVCIGLSVLFVCLLVGYCYTIHKLYPNGITQ